MTAKRQTEMLKCPDCGAAVGPPPTQCAKCGAVIEPCLTCEGRGVIVTGRRG